jgi:hypothetical protein
MYPLKSFNRESEGTSLSSHSPLPSFSQGPPTFMPWGELAPMTILWQMPTKVYIQVGYDLTNGHWLLEKIKHLP